MNNKPQNDENFDVFELKIETSPENGLTINGKSLKELEDTITEFMVTGEFTWWEFAAFTTWLAAGQVASMDLKNQSHYGLVQWSDLITQLYRGHIEAQLSGANVALPGHSEEALASRPLKH